MTVRVLIVGAGQAGLQLAASLREDGFAGSIVLLGDEPHAPYQRPPLSKSYFAGSTEESLLYMQEAGFFGAHDIAFIPNERATAIRRHERRLDLASGGSLVYDHLVLATGTRNRVLGCTGAALDNVISLRGLDDARKLRAACASLPRIVVVGAGFLGLEAAAVAAAQGCAVHVVEASARVLGRVAAPPVSAVVQHRHEAAGVDFTFNDTVVAVRGRNGAASHVELRGGAVLPADLVLVAIGVVPNTELAATAELAVQDGILVDATLATADPAIAAIGDCASFPYAAEGGRRVRLESVQNAVDQARHVARRILGKPAAYDQVPLFWSDQAGLRLQMAGLTTGSERHVVRGNPEAAAFSIYCYRNDQLVAVESVNRPPDHMLARKLLRARISPDPDRIVDPAFDPKSLFVEGVMA